MEGIYDLGSVYSIISDFILEKPYVSTTQTTGNYYDSILGQKYYSFDGMVEVVPIGFDVKDQMVIVSVRDMHSRQEVSDTYIACNEIRNRKLEICEHDLSCTALIKKEDFILNATLKVV